MTRIRYAAASYPVDQLTGVCPHRHRTIEAAIRCAGRLGLPAILVADGRRWRQPQGAELRAGRFVAGRWTVTP